MRKLKNLIAHESVRLRHLGLVFCGAAAAALLVALGSTTEWWRFIVVAIGVGLGVLVAALSWLRYVPWRLHNLEQRLDDLSESSPLRAPELGSVPPMRPETEIDLLRAELRLEFARAVAELDSRRGSGSDTDA